MFLQGVDVRTNPKEAALSAIIDAVAFRHLAARVSQFESGVEALRQPHVRRNLVVLYLLLVHSGYHRRRQDVQFDLRAVVDSVVDGVVACSKGTRNKE